MVTSNVSQAQPGDLFVDFATELTPRIAEALAKAGVKGVMQYTPYDNTNRFKFGSAAEAKIAHDHGMYYMLNWEIQADRGLQGYVVGRSDGARNRAAARAMGYPERVSVPVSIDMNTVRGNIDAVAGFVRGHFETDGDLADINFAYLDTDGGRALDDRGINVSIWIPGAFSWSPELYSVRNDRPELMRRASANPQAYCIQFPSEDFQGLLRIDRNIVLKPFNVWCADYVVSPPPVINKPDGVTPPVITNPSKEDDMATVVTTIQGRNAQFVGNGSANSDGSWHCREVEWFGPGGSAYVNAVNQDTNVKRQTLAQGALSGMTLLGDPEEIEDNTGAWDGHEFRRVIRYS